jgi:hypothetical protein
MPKLLIEIESTDQTREGARIETASRYVDWPFIPRVGETICPHTTHDNAYPVLEVTHEIRKDRVSIILRADEASLLMGIAPEIDDWIVSSSDNWRDAAERINKKA